MRWKDEARAAVFASMADLDAVPVYLVPKPKPWWAFWRRTEWETVRGLSRRQIMRAHGLKA